MIPITYSLAFLAAVFVHSGVGRSLTESAKEKTHPSPESNILTQDLRNNFEFTVYPAPSSPSWGQAKHVADERQWLFTNSWPNYGVYTKQDAEGVAFIRVNLKRHYYVKAFAISGYAGGNHKPVGSFFLEGSSDGADWKMVAEGQAHQWHAPGTYPFRPEQIIHAIYPGRYKQYRVIAKGWVKGEMLVYNWGLFT
eukprot:Seg1783.10 transcript_id=Seg1783.10/GoldUCD/mRNA.D3Y31 product="hypothetical protein" protein_id=Seg1783.10/GoldUCD/D3Y31